MTMVDGKILYENGEYKTIDIEKVRSEVERVLKA
jgi:5-methylthioadenosine/S-adenosylhomocysteine deaminase